MHHGAEAASGEAARAAPCRVRVRRGALLRCGGAAEGRPARSAPSSGKICLLSTG
jgi:hypothetical protein